jgi:molybdopterin molybdotransferase
MRTGLSVAEAQGAILERVRPLPGETTATVEARGRVLAEAVESTRTLPPADCSAMDGYAVRRDDLAGACERSPVRLPLAFEVAAGHASARPLEPGTAARIFTGAPVPEGADAVVRQEDSRADEAAGEVAFLTAPGLREHIRDAGEDVARGDRVLEPGTVLRAPHLGLLASLGRSVVEVHQRPHVAILSGGDELVEPDRDVAGGRIVSSNSYTLAAQCREVGAEPVYLGIARDRPEDLERCLRAGLRADCIVSSAGVSVGDHDYVRPVLEKLGCRLVFWGVHMKPGFPLTFGHFEDDRGPLVFGLPGNPVSASVTFELFVRPVLLRLAGHRRLFRPVLRARLAEALSKKPGRTHFVRVELARDGDGFVARPTGNQSSGVLTSLGLADGLAVFPADASALAEGDTVDVHLLDESVLHSEQPGYDV